jgi:hypothetical protein
MKLAASHRFRIHPLRMPMAVLIFFCCIFNSILYRIQRYVYGRRIDEVEIEHPPIFIIGHWRSGTTFLHELMARDSQFAFPTTYECFVPHHFMLTRGLMTRFGGWLLPRKRPMDNMAAAWDRPQEDEFALCAQGVGSPYLRMAFPNDEPDGMEFLDMRDVAADDLAEWKAAMLNFARAVTLNRPKRLMLKSPPHTGRIEVLSELFPGAMFVHISRNPYSIFPSTQRLWRALDRVQGLQLPKHANLDEYIFTCLERMYGGYEAQREKIDPSQLVEVAYEQLVADPLGELRRIYDHLGLEGFAEAKSGFEEHLDDQKDYQTNRHDLDPNLKSEIHARWAGYFERYGYEP